MASLTKQRGKWVLQAFVAGKRRTMYLGTMPERDARAFRASVAELVTAKESGYPIRPSVAQWLNEIGAAYYAKLEQWGIVAKREAKASTFIGDLFTAYKARRTDLKPRTIANLEQARGSVVKFFGEKRDISSISVAEAKDWQRDAGKRLAEATVATFVKKVRQVFADAVERRLLEQNPFAVLTAGSFVNEDKQQYISSEDIQKVIGKCPSHEWRLLFAFARYAGLRVPSETRKLEWQHIDFEANRIIVHSPKTEHHKGKARRTIPIFPELLPYLLESHQLAEDGVRFVFARLRGDNLSTTGDKIIERAGLEPWPRTYQNLRSSCETDLTTRFPLHVACAWIGNTERVAVRHYLQVTDEHFSAAVCAVDSAGQYRTSTGQAVEKPLENQANQKPHYPQGESNSLDVSVEIRKNAYLAMQKALHDVKSSLPEQRRKDLEKLEQAIRSSSSPTGGPR